MFDKKDFLETVEKRPNQSKQQQVLSIGRIAQGTAALMQGMMTESPNWNRYLQILQGLLETLKLEKKEAEKN